MSPTSWSDVRAVIFDLDDTLCGYWTATKAGMLEAFTEFGPEGYTPKEMTQHWASAFRKFAPNLKETGWYEIYLKNGEPTRTEQMRLTLLEIGIEDSELARKIGDAYGKYRDANLELFHESILVLDTLKNKGYPMGLMTNGPADIQRQEIATCGIESYFKTIQIEGEMGFGKPNIECFRIAEKNHGFAPHEMLMVGNSYNHDIKAAHQAGWKTAWVRRATDVAPSATKPEEKPDDGVTPDWIGSDLSDLIQNL